MKQIPSERSYKLHAVFLQLPPTELFDEKKKKYSFNIFTVFPECWIHTAADWHKAQVDESRLWASYDPDAVWKSGDF